MEITTFTLYMTDLLLNLCSVYKVIEFIYFFNIVKYSIVERSMFVLKKLSIKKYLSVRRYSLKITYYNSKVILLYPLRNSRHRVYIVCCNIVEIIIKSYSLILVI